MTSSIIVIAELSANHNGSLELAKKTILAAKESGADAVKIQTYTADTMTLESDREEFIVQGDTLWDGRKLYDLYVEAHTPWEWHKELQDYCNDLGLIFFSSPFDQTAVDFLEELHVPMYKIASFEITDVPLIRYAASKGKPMIISTGIATIEEIEEAILACKEVGNEDITLLKCTSQYPALIEDANLLTIEDIRTRFHVKVGLSDHTMGDVVATTAASMGITMIEKHFILDRSLGGPDAAFSMEPKEFKLMVERVREVEKALGSVDYEMNEKKQKSRVFSRSLFVVNDIKQGEVFSIDNVRSIRPGYGLPPKHIDEVIGRVATMNLEKGTPLKWEHIKK
jgi:pseudaminic acid synthase